MIILVHICLLLRILGHDLDIGLILDNEAITLFKNMLLNKEFITLFKETKNIFLEEFHKEYWYVMSGEDSDVPDLTGGAKSFSLDSTPSPTSTPSPSSPPPPPGDGPAIVDPQAVTNQPEENNDAEINVITEQNVNLTGPPLVLVSGDLPSPVESLPTESGVPTPVLEQSLQQQMGAAFRALIDIRERQALSSYNAIPHELRNSLYDRFVESKPWHDKFMFKNHVTPYIYNNLTGNMIPISDLQLNNVPNCNTCHNVLNSTNNRIGFNKSSGSWVHSMCNHINDQVLFCHKCTASNYNPDLNSRILTRLQEDGLAISSDYIRDLNASLPTQSQSEPTSPISSSLNTSTPNSRRNSF